MAENMIPGAMLSIYNLSSNPAGIFIKAALVNKGVSVAMLEVVALDPTAAVQGLRDLADRLAERAGGLVMPRN